MNNKTAGIIIIGDEILSGMVKDSNSNFIIDNLRDTGVEIKRILTIGDNIDEIAEEIKFFSQRYDLVFTSGGIGPTHDDVTIEAIAKAFDVEIVKHETLIHHLKMIIGREPSDVQLRMSLIPKGAEVIPDKGIGLPLIIFRNIYILPGIPKCLQKKILLIKSLIGQGNKAFVKKVYVNDYESSIALTLSELSMNDKEIKIGSYPTMDSSDYRVMVSFTSYDEEALQKFVELFISTLPKEKIVRIENWDTNE
ncbi:MAG: molybdopterin-binding protein [Thermodesulfovibrionales bacterium]|nr:molybdopterin-binding protein [Thermodesulfovibrionales bacterium]